MGDQAFRFAQSCKTTLYKFRPYQTTQEREWVREIIQDHKVYFPRASELNDPFDMSPRFESITRERLLAAAEAFWSSCPDASPEERVRNLEYLAGCDLAKHAAATQARVGQRMKNYFVFSLAGNRDHPMLWSHYARGHTGLCIHFRADKASIFGLSLGVIYGDDRPLLPVELRSISQQEIFQRITLRKGKFWEYEDEYRFARYPDTDYSDYPIRFDGQHACFRPSELSGITVGTRMPPSDVDAVVLNLAATHNPRLTVWRAFETDSFALGVGLKLIISVPWRQGMQ